MTATMSDQELIIELQEAADWFHANCDRLRGPSMLDTSNDGPLRSAPEFADDRAMLLRWATAYEEALARKLPCPICKNHIHRACGTYLARSLANHVGVMRPSYI